LYDSLVSIKSLLGAKKGGINMYPSHDKDVYGWAVHTAQLLKDKKMNEVDFDGIIEELEEMGISNKHALKNRLAQLIFHLLKWQFQPDLRCRSWTGTVREQRIRLNDILEENPSLKSYVLEAIVKAYKISLTLIEKETPLDLKMLPAECPYTFEQIMNDEFYPE
jgi:hypothetical protein